MIGKKFGKKGFVGLVAAALVLLGTAAWAVVTLLTGPTGTFSAINHGPRTPVFVANPHIAWGAVEVTGQSSAPGQGPDVSCTIAVVSGALTATMDGYNGDSCTFSVEIVNDGNVPVNVNQFVIDTPSGLDPWSINQAIPVGGTYVWSGLTLTMTPDISGSFVGHLTFVDATV